MMINPSDPRIKADILRMILQYLQDEGYTASFLTVQDEANLKLAEQQGQRAQLKRVRGAHPSQHNGASHTLYPASLV